MAEGFSPMVSLVLLAGNIVSLVLVLLAAYYASGRANLTSNVRLKAWLAIAAFLIAWLGLAALLATAGFFETTKTTYNPAIAFLAIPLIAGLWALGSSSVFRKIVEATPPEWLMLLQVPRLLGYSFLVLYAQGLMPAEFAIPSGVGDIIIGFSAPFIAYAVLKKLPWARSAAINWNYLGVADLALAIALGILTSPTPFQPLAHQLPNALITQFPLVMIPTFAVPLSILLHVYALRVLNAQK